MCKTIRDDYDQPSEENHVMAENFMLYRNMQELYEKQIKLLVDVAIIHANLGSQLAILALKMFKG